jgi:ABC-type phosphate transport system permease subunit
MEIVSVGMAEKILKMVEAGTENVHAELAEILNQFINYMIFLEAMSLLKWLLLFIGAGIVARAFNFWTLACNEPSDVHVVKGIRNLVVGGIVLLATFISISSAVGLGKILIAPKIYLIEMAIEKVKEVKASSSVGEMKK